MQDTMIGADGRRELRAARTMYGRNAGAEYFDALRELQGYGHTIDSAAALLTTMGLETARELSIRALMEA